MTTFLRCLLVFSVACSSCEEPDAPRVMPNDETPDETTDEATDETPREAHVGTVRGTITLAEGVELPQYTIEEVSGPQALAPWSENCSPERGVDHRPVQMTDDGRGLSNIVVYAGSEDHDAFFGALPAPEPTAVPVRIEDCRLSPSVLALTRGDTLEVTQATENEALLPVIGQSNFMEVIPYGETREFPLEQGGVFRMHCAFASPCARMDLVVLYHQVHTVTDETGHFELPNVPAGQEIQIVAWHPLFSFAQGTIRVDEDGEAELNLELNARPEPAAPPEPTEGDGETPEIF